MKGKYTIISGDSHLDLAPDRWTHRVPAKWRSRAPRRVKLESGEDAVVIEDRPPAPDLGRLASAVAGGRWFASPALDVKAKEGRGRTAKCG